MLSACELRAKQRKINAVFVQRRDAGLSIYPIYRYLLMVEAELSRRGLFW